MKVELFEGRIIAPLSKANEISGVYELTPFKKKRTNPQNKYYWCVLVKFISEETGFDKDTTHAKLGERFRKVMGKGTPYVESTTKLTTKQMEEMNENIRRWGAEFLNLNLPLPNEVDYSKIEEG